MTARLLKHILGAAAIAAMTAAPASAQDTLARAKNFYASASYEEALLVLEHLRPSAPGAEVAEVSAYQVFCLVALGRNDEAKQAVEALVRADPMYRPSEGLASPRVRAFFDTVRRPLLPDIAKSTYAQAKEAFNRKDLEAATAGFDRVVSLVGELNPVPPDAADLRTLANGFKDLIKAATPPKPVVSAAPEPTPVPPPAPPAPPKIYGAEDADVTKPVAISRTLPAWKPVDTFEARQQYEGVLEVIIGEDGKVISASIVKSIQIRYDPTLLKTALTWTFRPATKNGEPVRFRALMDIKLTK